MVKKNPSDSSGDKRAKGKIKKLKLIRETIKDLPAGDASKIKGGRAHPKTANCPPNIC